MARCLDPDFVALRMELVAAWQGLGADEQEALALAVFEDLTSRQAGRVLGITSAAYRLRLMRARHALRRQLDSAGLGSTNRTALQET